MRWISDASGYAETTRALDAAGIPWFGQGDVLALPGLDIVGLTDIDTNGSPQTDLLTPALLDRLVRPDANRPVVAFVHWGREYIAEPSARENDARRRDAAALGLGDHRRASACGEQRRHGARRRRRGRVLFAGQFPVRPVGNARRQARWSKCGSSSRERSSCAQSRCRISSTWAKADPGKPKRRPRRAAGPSPWNQSRPTG